MHGSQTAWVFMLTCCVLVRSQGHSDKYAHQPVAPTGYPSSAVSAAVKHDMGKCKSPNPTLFLMPGLVGSQLIGTQEGSAQHHCPHIAKPVKVYYQDQWFLNLECWAHMMSMEYDESSSSFRNSTGTALWPDEAGWPDGTQQRVIRTFYAALLLQLKSKHGYIMAKDLFFVPYDWRVGIRGLEGYGYQRIAARVADAVKLNCGQKAIIMAHSYGANAMLYMLKSPEYKAWRETNIKGFMMLGPAFGGAVVPLQALLSGDYLKMYPVLSNFLPTSLTSKLPTTPIEKALTKVLRVPSMTFLLPNTMAFAREHVVVVTPDRNYTVTQQKELLTDMGFVGGAAIAEDSSTLTKQMLENGPVPGVPTYCIYGAAVPTPTAVVYEQAVLSNVAMQRPAAVVTAPGDGVADLKSMRLCSRLAPSSHLEEIANPLIDHASLISHPIALERISSVLIKLGVQKFI